VSAGALNYAIDDEDRLIRVDDGYYRSAEENGWDGAGASLGRSLWDFVADRTGRVVLFSTQVRSEEEREEPQPLLDPR
jgi:hypothetical protein